MTHQRISQTLCIQVGNIVCRCCGHVLTKADKAWKSSAALTTVAVGGLPGAASAKPVQVVLRQFSCPGCGGLLDTETAMPDDPYLDDIVDAVEATDGRN